jgi:tetratricopeptide (TPR) repeat protein/class 3 adenylate cyclase
LLPQKYNALSNSFLPSFIVHQIAASRTHGQAEAYAICMDLSGFTALTAKLMEKGPQGAEEMSYALNHIFQPMVKAVYEAGGFIPYFAGDSFTGLFIGGMSAVRGVQLLQMADVIMSRFREETREKKGLIAEYGISAKIGLSYGALEWGIVGKQRKSFYFRGAAIDGSAQAQMRADRGEICIEASLLAELSPHATMVDLEAEKFYKIKKIQTQSAVVTHDPVAHKSVPNEVLSAYFPKELLNQADTSGEFRNVTTVFIAFDVNSDQALLHEFASVVLEQSLQFSGYFKEIDHGDKGGLMCILFGAPVAFENNTERALEFALSVQDEVRNDAALAQIKWKIGISSGTAFAGIIGGSARNQYAAVGARVNLAARLMASAKWGQIVTDENVHRNRSFRFEAQGAMVHKGFSEPIERFVLEGRNLETKTGYSGTYIGRESEIQTLLAAATDPLSKGKFAGITVLFGEPGIGKSRLSWEFRKRLSAHLNLRWMVCRSDQILRKPFNPFLLFIKQYFDQEGEHSASENLEAFQKSFSSLLSDLRACNHPRKVELEQDLTRLRYVLAALSGLRDEEGWSKLDGRTRYQLALQATSVLVQSEACIQPVVLDLEDAHWYDDMSKEFLHEFVRKAAAFPILFHVSSRYDDNGNKLRLFQATMLEEYQIPHVEIDLRYLSQLDMTAFAESRLDGQITQELSDLLYRMSQGNPFYAEQLVEYFRETSLLTHVEGTYGLGNTEIRISESVKEIMMARIDRLSGLVKETVKAAAVIGREFEVDILTGVMARHIEFIKRNGNMSQVLNEQIRTAEQGQIWHAINELRYIFKHSLLREAAYDMQLHTRLRDLHLLIAEVIESQYPNNEERYFDLAFHYEQAGATKQMQHYQELAGRYAQKNYQNKQALLCYDKLLESYAGGGRKKHIKIWLRRGAVQETIGMWDNALESYETALLKAMHVSDARLIGRSYRRLGQLLMLRGDYDQARTYFEKAIAQFELKNDQVGIAKALGNMGAIYFRQGKYEEAKHNFLGAIEMNIAAGLEVENAPFVANLGLVAMNQSKYDEAISRLEHQIDVNESVGDKAGLATLYTNLGIVYLEKGVLENARLTLEKGLAISEELDNKLFMTICIGSLGKVWERLGDHTKAMQLYDRDITLVENLGDKQGQAIAYHLKGELLSQQGDYTNAMTYLEKASQLAQQLNYRKGLAKTLNAIGDLYFAQQNLPEAESHYTQALALCQETGYLLLLCETHIELGEVYILANRIEEAQAQYDLAAPLAETLEQERINIALVHLRQKLEAQ